MRFKHLQAVAMPGIQRGVQLLHEGGVGDGRQVRVRIEVHHHIWPRTHLLHHLVQDMPNIRDVLVHGPNEKEQEAAASQTPNSIILPSRGLLGMALESYCAQAHARPCRRGAESTTDCPCLACQAGHSALLRPMPVALCAPSQTHADGKSGKERRHAGQRTATACNRISSRVAAAGR